MSRVRTPVDTRGLEEPRQDGVVSEQFRVARVSGLPYAHNPWKCANAVHFEEGEWNDAQGWRFFESLTEEDLRGCGYHQLTDWKLVARIGVQLFRRFWNDLMSGSTPLCCSSRLGTVSDFISTCSSTNLSSGEAKRPL